MKLCIPTLGAIIRLNEEWEFKLYFEGVTPPFLVALLTAGRKWRFLGTLL